MITRWQDWDHLLIGLWIFLSPWFLGHAPAMGPESWSAWILGGAIAALAIAMLFTPQRWEEPVNIVLGICLILSPWVLGFSHLMTATASSSIAGLLVITFAGWAMFDASTDGQTQAPPHGESLRH